MSHHPDFSLGGRDVRDWFVDVIITIAIVVLMIDGWLAWIGG